MAKTLITDLDVRALKSLYENAKPFNHIIIDNFWKPEIADQLQKEIASLNMRDEDVTVYDNAIEKKITCNHYDRFPKKVYQAFTYLNSNQFLEIISSITQIKKNYNRHRIKWWRYTYTSFWRKIKFT